MSEFDKDLMDLIQDERGFLIERVRTIPYSSLSTSLSASALFSNAGVTSEVANLGASPKVDNSLGASPEVAKLLGALPDAENRLVEVRFDLHRAALAFLVDAFRIWQLYGNFR